MGLSWPPASTRHRVPISGGYESTRSHGKARETQVVPVDRLWGGRVVRGGKSPTAMPNPSWDMTFRLSGSEIRGQARPYMCSSYGAIVGRPELERNP